MIESFISENCLNIGFSKKIILDNNVLYEDLIDIVESNGLRRVNFNLSNLSFVDICILETLYKVVLKFSGGKYNFFIVNPDNDLIRFLVLMDLTDRLKIKWGIGQE